MVVRMEIRLKKKIVFVDDEVLMREMWKRNLTDEGYEVFTAATAEEGIQISEQEKPDLIISDILMPQMDGLSLCEQIRKRDSLCDIPIILITGVFKDLEFRSRIDRSTADEFLLKPLDKKQLYSSIKRLLEPSSRALSQIRKSLIIFFSRGFKSSIPSSAVSKYSNIRISSGEISFMSTSF